MSMQSTPRSRFQLGLDAGPLGRWTRLILGGLIPLISIMIQLSSNPPSVAFYGTTVLYFAAVLAVYLAAHYLLGERLLDRANPWIGTLILVGPPTLLLALRLGPPAFQLGLALYVSISLILNFVMSYGGCEVMAIPSVVFRRRYVVYCPWNVIDVVDKALTERRAEAQTS